MLLLNMQNSHKIQGLVTEIKNGNKKSEKTLFNILIVRFEYLAKKRIKGEDSKDIAMDACKTVLEKYGSIDFENDRFEFWALKILRHKIGNYLQKKKTMDNNWGNRINSDYIAAAESADNMIELKLTIQQCVRKIINGFPKYARILNLVHLGYKTDEICKRMNIKPSYYYVLLSRCRAMLSKCLERGTIR